MKWVVTAKEMRNIDQRTIDKIGIPGSTLMERAGLEVMDAIFEYYGPVDSEKVSVFCGKGNNGGDGLVIAREMKRKGADVTVYLFGKASQLTGDTLSNYNILKKMQITVEQILTEAAVNAIPDDADIVIDALLGTGIKGEVTGILRNMIQRINMFSGLIVSIDIPSGVNTDTGAFMGDAISADLTVTMGLLKRGLLLYPGRALAGDIDIADIGFPEKGISPEKVRSFLIEKADVQTFLPQRQANYYKGDCGRAFILGGARGMTGAAALTANGALRAGVGMTLLGVPESLNPVMEQKLTETMTLALPETENGSISLSAESKILDALLWANVLAIGPGISRDEETMELVRRIVAQAEVPVVIDADGLYAFVKDPMLLKKRDYPTTITPHHGEFARLIHENAGQIEFDRMGVLRKYAKKWNSVVLFKGAPTLIGNTNGDLFINQTGNSGMATSGSGDLLTGIIAGLMGQGADPVEAGIAGAYLHGLAGDIAAEELGEYSMTAGDLVDFLPYAFQELITKDEDDEENQEYVQHL